MRKRIPNAIRRSDARGAWNSPRALLRSAAGWKCLLLLLALGFAGVPLLFSQEDEPPASKKGVRIAFIPPPMEGALSLGIYDKKGKLVRVLAHEATEKDFTVGLNGFITTWDGRDNNGKPLPAGMYSASGFAVGALEVEGIAYHGNDWMVADDSPRLRRILSLELRKSGSLVLWAEGADGKPQLVRMDQAGEFKGEIPADPQVSALAVGGEARSADDTAPARAEVEAGKVTILEAGQKRTLSLPNIANPIDASLGQDGRIWVVDQTAEKTEVKEFSLVGEFRRRLAIDPTEPAPKRIFASRTSELIFLIEEKAGLQRVRGLALESVDAPADPTAGADASTSTWKTVLSKTIQASETFAAINSQMGLKKPFLPEEKFTVRLQPNPLLKDESSTVHVNVARDNVGSLLQTLDGLPLRRLTETPNLKWVVIGREGSGKQLSIFQSDGAVVEEFRARRLANMMAFDAGDYEWTGK